MNENNDLKTKDGFCRLILSGEVLYYRLCNTLALQFTEVTLLSALMGTENRFSEILLFRNLLVTLETQGLLDLFIHASCLQTPHKYFRICLSINDRPAFLVLVVK